MSGGSFDYLCELPVSDIDSRHIDTLQAMAEQLEEIAWGHPATRATRAHVERLKAAVDPYADLRPVWRAVEWWKSSDCSREQVEEALDEYADKTENAGWSIPGGFLSHITGQRP